MPNNPTPMTRQQQVAMAKDKMMTQLGKSGVVLLKGVVSQEEYNKDLAGRKGLEVWDQMRRSDGTVRAALLAVKLMILGANWRMESPSDDPRHMLATQLCEQSLFNNIDFDKFAREGFTFLDMGHSVFEQTFATSKVDGKEYTLLSDLGFRKQTSIVKWEAEIDGVGVEGITQQLQGGGKVGIPEVKLTRFVFDQEGENKEGVSLLRAAYKHWYIKDTLYQVDAIKHEKQGLGILKIKTPSTASNEDKQAARDIAREQRANEEAYIEELEGFNFDFMDMKAGQTTDIMPSVNHHNRQILASVLSQFLDIGSAGSSGSYSASDNQLDIFIQSEEAIAKIFAGAVNNTVVRNICMLNGLELDEYPKLTYDRIGQDNIQVFSDALNKLFTSGAITPDPELENYLRQFLHLPEMSDEMLANYDDIRAMRRNPSQPTMPTPNNSAPTEASELIRQARDIRDKLQKAGRESNN